MLWQFLTHNQYKKLIHQKNYKQMNWKEGVHNFGRQAVWLFVCSGSACTPIPALSYMESIRRLCKQ